MATLQWSLSLNIVYYFNNYYYLLFIYLNFSHSHIYLWSFAYIYTSLNMRILQNRQFKHYPCMYQTRNDKVTSKNQFQHIYNNCFQCCLHSIRLFEYYFFFPFFHFKKDNSGISYHRSNMNENIINSMNSCHSFILINLLSMILQESLNFKLYQCICRLKTCFFIFKFTCLQMNVLIQLRLKYEPILDEIFSI